MKNISIIAILVLLMCSMYSCQDFLTPEVKTEIFLNDFGKTPTEGDFLLTQAYSDMRNDNFVGSIYWSLFTTDYNVPNPGTVLARSFISRLQNDPTDGDAFNIWTSQYKVISSANLALRASKAALATTGITPSDSSKWSRITGEAKFIRGLAYFNLVRLFRNVPIIEQYFQDFDQINSVSNAPADKMGEQEQLVYDFIINDLTEAATRLSETSERGRANRFSSKALLGKVHLNRASIEKFRDKKGDGLKSYTDAVTQLNDVINSNRYNLKTYFPDNFIRDKQYTGNNEFLFTLEFHELDKSNFNIFGQNSGFFNNSAAGSTVNVGSLGTANGGSFPTDFGWSAFDLDSPGDWVRRFWTFEDAEFRSYDANGSRNLQNTLSDCPNGQGPGCEIFLRSSEPYPWNRPYWYETIDNANSFRSNPSTADVITYPDKSTSFSIIWGGGGANATPNIKLGKFRRHPITQATYTDATFDADYPVMRYSEVLLMFAEAANELVGPNAKPANAKFTPREAVNLVRARARNFVYYNDISATKRISENSPYTATYGQVFSRQAKVGKSPATTANAADTIKKYYYEISVVKGLRESPAVPVIRNFRDFPETKDWVPDFSASLNSNEFRDQLLDERWRELAGEGNNRWFDLVRYGTLISKVQAAQTTINPLTNRSLQAAAYGTSVLRLADNKYTYLAIPQSEINRNSNLKQNLGY